MENGHGWIRKGKHHLSPDKGAAGQVEAIPHANEELENCKVNEQRNCEHFIDSLT